MLKRALRPGASHRPWSSSITPRASRGLLAGGPLLAGVARAARDPRPGVDRARRRVPRHDPPGTLFPSIKDRFQIRANVLAALRGEK